MSADLDLKALLLGVVIGLVIGSFVGGALPIGPSTPSYDTSTPATSYSSSGPSCYEGPQDNSGWLHVVANGETWAITLNATVVHPPGTQINVSVSQRPTDAYEIRFQTVETTSKKPLSNPGCQIATSLNIATALERPDFVVTMNGRTIRAISQEETVANLYPLPNPINASA